MALICLQAPLVEPVSLAELKLYLRSDPDDTAQDNEIAELGVAARAWCETYTKRRFVQQQWQLSLDFFPGYIDSKLAGQRVSSPFVSGANAILVGIRYALILPHSPVRTLDAFSYQNANGQVTGLILGPFTIASVTNNNAQPVQVTTTQPHTLVTGGGVLLAGNAALLALLGGQAFQAVTVLDANNFLLNGTVGTGAGIAGGGSATGYNFVQDLLSNPARLTPVFGQMWPVARVVVNAVQVNMTVGYGLPVTLATTAVNNQVTASGYVFQPGDIGRPLSIPGGGANGADLNTIITAIGSAPATQATLRDTVQATLPRVMALLANVGKPEHWSLIKRGIKTLTLGAYEKRLPVKQLEDSVERMLYPVRDLRV